jgi:hypothetical protein
MFVSELDCSEADNPQNPLPSPAHSRITLVLGQVISYEAIRT